MVSAVRCVDPCDDVDGTLVDFQFAAGGPKKLFPASGIVGNDSGNVVVCGIFLEARAYFSIVDECANTDDVDMSMLWVRGDEGMTDAVVDSEHG